MGNFLSIWRAVSFSGRTLLYGVSLVSQLCNVFPVLRPLPVKTHQLYVIPALPQTHNSIVSIMSRLGTGRCRVQIPKGTRYFSKMFRSVVWLTQPHIHWVLGAVLLGIKWPGHDAYTHQHVVLKLRISGAICLHPLYAFIVCTWTALLFLLFTKYAAIVLGI
jgi:hypothetical protein